MVARAYAAMSRIRLLSLKARGLDALRRRKVGSRSDSGALGLALQREGSWACAPRRASHDASLWIICEQGCVT